MSNAVHGMETGKAIVTSMTGVLIQVRPNTLIVIIITSLDSFFEKDFVPSTWSRTGTKPK